MGIQSKNWSLVLINGFNQHLQKGVLQFNTSPVEDPKLSLVSQLYLNLCLLILTLSFVLGFDRLFTLTLPLWYTNSSYSFTFTQYIPLPPPNPPVFYSTGGSFLSIWLPQIHFPLRRKTVLYFTLFSIQLFYYKSCSI